MLIFRWRIEEGLLKNGLCEYLALEERVVAPQRPLPGGRGSVREPDCNSGLSQPDR